ncbi:NAD(P)H-dependent flavin oxidoreductase [Pararhodobacter oceanensis]|uniref:NAD(P)H-dependent flavin oxidoreductase n=1 Tax=Pararhodobacter oceanensis TaxID=2172121 RepID=UPI003A95DBD5
MSPRFGSKDLRAELVTRLGAALPAIAAPMFIVSGVELVSAVCAQGMVGAFPSLNARDPEELRGWLAQLNAKAQEPGRAAYGVNLVTHRSNARFAADLEVCAEARVPLIITALGGPKPAIDAVHGWGGLVFADVNSPKFARKAAEAGVDGLILVCNGAGGHTGLVSPFAFVDEVRSFFDGPIVVAGGISSGGAIRATQLIGADLAYLGTRFLAADESNAVEDYKAMVVDSSYDDIIATDAITGALANKLRPSLLRAGIDPDTLQGGGGFDLSALEGKAKRWRDLWSAGHGVGASQHRQSAADIVAELKAGYQAAG